jgi:hypothetical protein
MDAAEAEVAVRAMLSAAGLSPPPEEVAQLVAGYPALRAAADALYQVPAARYADPALRFRAADTARVDWAEG